MSWHRGDTSLSPAAFLAIADRGIGDGLTLLPSLQALQRARPDLSINLLTPGLFSLAENVRGIAHIVDPRPLAGLDERQRLEWLHERNFVWVWNTEGRNGMWGRALAEIPRPTWITAPTQQSWGSRNVVRVRFQELRALFPELQAPGAPTLSLTPDQLAMRDAFRARFRSDHRLIAVQPGAGDPRREWSADKFRAMITRLADRPRVTVVLFLGDSDSVFHAAEYLPRHPHVVRVAEPLHSAVPKLAACDLFIGNDSGFYHLAFALGLKVVGVYRSLRGSQRWGHRSPRSRQVICWMPRQLHPDWSRWVSVRRVLRAARVLDPAL